MDGLMLNQINLFASIEDLGVSLNSVCDIMDGEAGA